MTVRRGEDWGVPATIPESIEVVRDDAALRELVVAAREAGRSTPEALLRGGDLLRTLGGPTSRSGASIATRVAVDVVEVELDDQRTWFVAHLVAGRWRWFTPTLVVMNAAFVGSANLGPRAHPGDGLVDITEGRLGLRDTLAARRREPTGTHLPHPALAQRRVRGATVGWSRPRPVRLDGVVVGRHRSVRVQVLPDALTVLY
jgi:hypothetical protein